MAPLLVTLLAALAPHCEAAGASPEACAAHVVALRLAPTATVRTAAARWLTRHAPSPAAGAVLPRVAALISAEPDEGVRSAAAVACAAVAWRQRLPVPTPVIDAVLFDTEAVATNAGIATMMTRDHPALTPEGLRRVFWLAHAREPFRRGLGVELLKAHGAAHPRTPAVLVQLTRDPDRWVRHNAHVGLFAVSGDLPRVVLYQQAERARHAAAPPLPAAASNDERTERSAWDFNALALRGLGERHAVERPAAYRAALIEASRSPDAAVRRQVLATWAEYEAGELAPEGVNFTDAPPEVVRAALRAVAAHPDTAARRAAMAGGK